MLPTLPPDDPEPIGTIAEARALTPGVAVTVRGTITAAAGVILTDRTVALQDDSGGIVARLPSTAAAAGVPLGTIVQLSGTLAAPYGNLELRMEDGDGLTIIGSGGLPEPLEIGADGVAEENEGRLVTSVGTITGVEARANGALSIGLREDDGAITVFAHGALQIDRGPLKKGQRIRATGIVGQRASRTDAADGYRIWPRSRADVQLLGSDDPGASPVDDEPGSGGPGGKRPPRVRIREAIPGTAVTIVGVVTSRAGLIDGDGRRVTVEDGSGAILVRYPADVAPAPVGRVVRAWGDVETWFGAPQLEAIEAPKRQKRRKVKPKRLKRPPGETDEWRLVSVEVGIDAIERNGDSWRAEASMGSAGQLPIVGLAGSGIPADALEEGRSARIVGIVRRAYPTASDQRFAVAPRSVGDIKLRKRTRVADASVEGEAEALGSTQELGSTPGTSLASLGSLAGLRVRVGGRLEALRGQRLTIQDGTASGFVRLDTPVDGVQPALRVGEIINAAGVVRTRPAGMPELIVRSAHDIWRASSLHVPAPSYPALLVAGVGASVPERSVGQSVTVNPTGASPSATLLLVLLAAISAIVAALALTLAMIILKRPGWLQLRSLPALARHRPSSPDQPDA